MLLSDPPEYLYVKGRLPSEEGRTAGMIGARQCSEYGSSAARFFAGELSRAGVGIVSGMALGFSPEKIREYVEETETWYPALLKRIKAEPGYNNAAFLLTYQLRSLLQTAKRIR